MPEQAEFGINVRNAGIKVRNAAAKFVPNSLLGRKPGLLEDLANVPGQFIPRSLPGQAVVQDSANAVQPSWYNAAPQGPPTLPRTDSDRAGYRRQLVALALENLKSDGFLRTDGRIEMSKLAPQVRKDLAGLTDEQVKNKLVNMLVEQKAEEENLIAAITPTTPGQLNVVRMSRPDRGKAKVLFQLEYIYGTDHKHLSLTSIRYPPKGERWPEWKVDLLEEDIAFGSVSVPRCATNVQKQTLCRIIEGAERRYNDMILLNRLHVVGGFKADVRAKSEADVKVESEGQTAIAL